MIIRGHTVIFENLVEHHIHGNVIARVLPKDYKMTKLASSHSKCKSEGKRLSIMFKNLANGSWLND